LSFARRIGFNPAERETRDQQFHPQDSEQLFHGDKYDSATSQRQKQGTIFVGLPNPTVLIIERRQPGDWLCFGPERTKRSTATTFCPAWGDRTAENASNSSGGPSWSDFWLRPCLPTFSICSAGRIESPSLSTA